MGLADLKSPKFASWITPPRSSRSVTVMCLVKGFKFDFVIALSGFLNLLPGFGRSLSNAAPKPLSSDDEAEAARCRGFRDACNFKLKFAGTRSFGELFLG